MKMKTCKRIEIAYIKRTTGCSAGTQVFIGDKADVLAANFQSRHPELREKSFKIQWA